MKRLTKQIPMILVSLLIGGASLSAIGILSSSLSRNHIILSGGIIMVIAGLVYGIFAFLWGLTATLLAGHINMVDDPHTKAMNINERASQRAREVR